MAKIDSKKIYKLLKNNWTYYNAEIHCPMVLDVMNTEGTVSAFCVRAQIGKTTFYDWVQAHSEFKRCYHLGQALAQANWEKEGEDGKDDPDFNSEYWRHIGRERYAAGRQQSRVRLDVDAEANPYEQYKQIIKQASGEEFTASELKQIMESINVGRGAFETFEMQKVLDKMKDDVDKMKTNHANNISSIASITETD